MSVLLSDTALLQRGHRDPQPNDRPKLKSAQVQTKSSFARLFDLAKIPASVAASVAYDWYEGSTEAERTAKTTHDNSRRAWRLRLKDATTYAEWLAAAKELDKLEGNDKWKRERESPDYDAKLIESRLQQLDSARVNGDVAKMVFLVRTALSRDLGDMGNLSLYRYSYIGTKDLIENYINSALETLRYLRDVPKVNLPGGLTARLMLEQVLSARQAFGRSALLLSGGATYGMNHNGVLKGLYEANLLPRIISGASAGSICSAVVCTRTDAEIPDLMENFAKGDLAVFEEEGNEDIALEKIARFMKFGALYDIKHLTRVMQQILGDITFQEAYNRTRRILNICVSSAGLYDLPRLLNFVTAPNVLIWSAVATSCSVPLIFSPATLLAKNVLTGEIEPWNPSPQKWIDGSVDNDLPMTRLAEMFNVNHFIVSQVNPHIVPFLAKEEGVLAHEAHEGSTFLSNTPQWLHTVTQLAKGEALYRVNTLADLGVFPTMLTKAASMLSQKYCGDITIVPTINYSNMTLLLTNPTEQFMTEAMLCGERATWPKLSVVRNHCAIELALDETVQALRTQAHFSPSRVDLRLAHAKTNTETSTPNRVKTRRRKLSQSSEPGTSQQAKSSQNSSKTVPRRIPNLKTRSLNLPDFSSKSDQRTIRGSDIKPTPFSPPPSSSHSADIPSSGADDVSHIFTSSSSVHGDSSDTVSPPGSPTSPEEWSKEPPRISHSVSQPTTPFGRPHGSFLNLTPLANSSQRRSSPAPPNSLAARSQIQQPRPATPPQSRAESKYKRLFHRGQPQEAAKKTVVPPAAAKKVEILSPMGTTSPVGRLKRANAAGMEIDVSGSGSDGNRRRSKSKQ